MKTNRLFLTVAIFVWLGVSLNARAETQVGLYGFCIPFPKEVPAFEPPRRLLSLNTERMVCVLVQLDSGGNIFGLSPEYPADSGLAAYVEGFLRELSLEPATMNGQKVASVLPVMLQFRPGAVIPQVQFPIDENGRISDADLYWKTFALNEIGFPGIVTFPSYFARSSSTSEPAVYPFVLVRLQLDDTGRLLNSEKVRSTCPGFDEQIMSALLYAKFSPAVVNGKSIASTPFLLVSLFPQMDYPTTVWNRESCDQLSLLNKLSLRMLPDTVGLMSKAIPLRIPPDRYPLGRSRPAHNMLSAYVQVDTLGRARIIRCSRAGRATMDTVRRIIGNLRFAPALDYDGKARQFSGLAYLRFTGSADVRIVYDWLR